MDENIAFVMPSATFSTKRNAVGTYTVIGVHGTRSGTAYAMLGRSFKPGDNPWAWPQGYACRIQQAVNAREGQP